jgi:hypothetical protein
MKDVSSRYKSAALLGCIMSFTLFSGNATAQDDTQNPSEHSITSYQNYRGLAELITMICDDAIYKLQGFFGPTVVEIQPFISFGQYQERKISSLGVSLADQMMAMVNNDTAANPGNKPGGQKTENQQKLRGVIQEVDGFLRVHINAVNVYGERMSYTTTVEMSEPIYRAMHTYL